MIINYETLVPAIYQKCQEALQSGESWELMRNKVIFSIFKSELKTAFDMTVLDFGGHNQSAYAGRTMLSLEKDSDSSSQSIHETIKENAIDALGYLVGDIYDEMTKDTSYEEIKAKMLDCPTHFYLVPAIHKGSGFSYCFVCGKSSVYYFKDGVISEGCKITEDSSYWKKIHAGLKIMLQNEGKKDIAKCEFPNGIDQYEQYMTIESDYIVVANDLRDLFTFGKLESMDYIKEKSGYYNTMNSELGIKYNQEYYLNKGLLQVQVGNTSPIIAYNSLTGAIMAVDPHAWKVKKKYTFPLSTDGFKSKVKISTPIWTVQVVDSIVLEKYAKDKSISLANAADELGGTLIHVTPGKYKVTNYNAHHYSDRPVFFSMEKID